MELQQTRTQRRLQQHVDAADKMNHKVNHVTGTPVMKQVIFWILMILAFICVISLGMILINYTLSAKV